MPEELRFDGQVAIITGAGRGIGREHALLLAARGAHVIVNDLGVSMDGHSSSGEPAARVAQEIRDAGGSAIADANSVASIKGAASIVERALSTWGRIDIIINNAGIGAFTPKPQDARPSVVDAVFATHLGGPMNILRAAWPHLEERGGGRVINTSSGTALGVDVDLAYPAAKAGVIGLTRCLALMGEPFGIRVNAIMPIAATRGVSQIRKPDVRAMIEEQFPASMIAPVVAWLAHETVAVTGETLSVGAGRVGRIVTMATTGYVDRDLSPESVAANIDEIMDLGELTLIRRGSDDTALMRPS